ncbi:hypothetical protein [Pedobacter sp. V48]|uniref:hypothetical protein n=1 Tax=Pedobacter sp. V48 TaxID=509635 RepID=UPI0003E51065|nr:hypothetical protein [Pedobacter sp. V48]ETZ21764.1 hypothetical protein N824_26370 [Pedobacter sp. V48]
MKVLISGLVVVALLIPAKAFTQDSSGVKLDLLKSPSSPASQLLSFSTSDIEKPTDLSSFMLSVQSSSASYTKLPSNYAIDIAPFWLFRTKTDFTTTGNAGLNSTKFKDYFKQSLVISIAIKNPDSSFNEFKASSTYGGLGIKFALFRPHYSKENEKILYSITQKQIRINKAVSSYIETKEKTDPKYKALDAQRTAIVNRIRDENPSETDFASAIIKEEEDTTSTLYRNKIETQELFQIWKNETLEIDDFKKMLVDSLSKEVAKFDGARVGFSWDLAGGISGEFRNKRFNSSKIFNSGIWTTVGYSSEKSGSFLGLARLLYNPDQIYAQDNATNAFGDISTFDAGFRYIYTKSKFSCSAEAIYRSILSSSAIDPSWKLVLNVDYAIASNQKLIFSFGRNFDGTLTKDGNLIAALTVLLGFGNIR